MKAKIKAIKDELRRRMHDPLAEQGKWLGSVVRGFFAYHAVPNNVPEISAFRFHVIRAWVRSSCRRRAGHDAATQPATPPAVGADAGPPRTLYSQGPCPAPMAGGALPRQTLKVGARCVSSARRDLCGGREATHVPTAIAACTGCDRHLPQTRPCCPRRFIMAG